MIIDELKNRIKELEGENLTLLDSCVELDMKVMQLEAQTQWQPIETCPDLEDVLVTNGNVIAISMNFWNPERDEYVWEGGSNYPPSNWLRPITHWMPLPELPEES